MEKQYKNSYNKKGGQSVIIADTSGLLALFNPNDQSHKAAVRAAEQLRNEHNDILVPTAVCVEFLNILGRKIGHKEAYIAIAALKPPFLIVNDNSNFLENQALKIFSAVQEPISFTDCLVMATASEYDTTMIYSSNRQFKNAGYHALIASTERVQRQIKAARVEYIEEMIRKQTSRDKALRNLIMKDDEGNKEKA